MGKAKDLVGNKIGMLTVLKRKRENNRTLYYCKCECGTEKWMRDDVLKKSKSCGCLQKEHLFKFKDLTGKKIGKLLVIERTNKRNKNNGSVIWKCKCDCGNYVEVPSKNLTRLEVRSCGCLSKEIHSNLAKKNSKNLVENNLKNYFIEGTNICVLKRNKLNSNNTSGVTGVSWDRKLSKWKAYITFKGKNYKLGSYSEKEDAIKARKEAEEKLHKQFLREKELSK